MLVCGTRSRQAGPAELTWALVLAVTRRGRYEDAAVRAGGWQTTIGPELSGRTLGVLGLGRLGSIVAGYGGRSGCGCSAGARTSTPAHARELGVEPVTLDDLLTRSDVVSVHLKLSDRTRGLLGAARAGPDRSGGYLVNTSRGPIVDEAALVEALRTGGSPAPASTCTTWSRCRPTTRCAPRRARCSPAHRLRRARHIPGLLRRRGRGRRRLAGRRARSACCPDRAGPAGPVGNISVGGSGYRPGHDQVPRLQIRLPLPLVTASSPAGPEIRAGRSYRGRVATQRRRKGRERDRRADLRAPRSDHTQETAEL